MVKINHKVKTILTIVLLILTNLALAQTNTLRTDTLQTALQKEIPVWMSEYHIPCVGVGIIENGKIKWVKNFGELKAGHPAPDNTLFNIASQTKPVTAMLTLKLVQLGKWDLDEPLSHYWIDPDIANDPYLPKLTTRIVLSHQTGFPNWRTDNGSTKLHFKFEPGTGFGYSGEGYEYLRRALEAKFQVSLAVLLDTYLLEPLNIKNTSYWSEKLDTNRFAMWHDGQGHRYSTSIHTSVNAADDLITTVEDYCKLGLYAMDNAGLYNKPEVKVKENYFRGLGWGLVQGLPNGEYAFEHGGSDIGVRTMAFFLPESKSGIVVMTNADNGQFVSDLIIKRALNNGAQLLETMNRGAVIHQRITIADNILQRYTGSFQQSNGKLIKVEQDGNALKVSGDGIPTAVVYPESNDQFFLDGYDVQLKFPDAGTLTVIENGKQVLIAHRLETHQQLKKDMNGIASDSTEGRFTGTPGYLKAANYVAGQLKTAGLKTRLQAVPFIWDNYDGSSITIGGKTYPHKGGNFIVLQRATAAVQNGKPAEIIRTPDQQQSADWETTVIRHYRFSYMHYAADRGLKNTTNTPANDSVTIILISPTLAAQLTNKQKPVVNLTFHQDHIYGYNVIATLPGEKNSQAQTIIIGAHLDHIGRLGPHIYNGANDDGSGCVAVLTAAKALAHQQVKRPLTFVFYCGEELNLLGSRYFMDHPPVPVKNILMNINLEQVGSKHRSFPGIWALGDEQFKDQFFNSGKMFDTQNLKFSPTDSVGDVLANTDSYSFMKKHVPSLLLGSGGFDEHHTTQDNIDLIDFDHLQKAGELLESLILTLANQP